MDNITATSAPATGEQAFGATEIIQGIMMRQAQGDTIDVFALVLSLDITDDLSKVRDYLVKSDICTKQEWNKAVHHKRIVDRLGVRPKTSVELVDVWVAQKGYRVDYQKVMHVPASHDMPEINADNLKRNRDMIAYHCITQQREVNTMTLKRDLRLLVDELRMGFSDRSIEDAVSSWFEAKVDARVLDVFADVRYAQGSAHRDATADAWVAVVSQFCADEHDAAFVEAVLRKFMWQVKRKMLGLHVPNHLMPVLLGPQGVGKSTFVRDVLLKPIAELVSGADFAEITDNRNIDLWRNFVIFVDEMGYAAKADIDTVKGRITATTLAMRPMRSNDSIQVRQNATFIGCSNKELDQLIRDETGNRRFVGLRFSAKPDWTLIAGVDTLALWNSVDEHGEDPMKPHQALLAQRQEDVRERSQVEQWLEQHQCPTAQVGRKQSAADLYREYSVWADTYFANRGMDVATWGKEFSRLIKSGQVEGWSRGGRSNGATTYVYQ